MGRGHVLVNELKADQLAWNDGLMRAANCQSAKSVGTVAESRGGGDWMVCG
jgi:hypothetical protein